MSVIHIFESHQLGNIRATVSVCGDPLLCAIDVARVLDFREPSRAVRDYCKSPCVLPTPTSGGVQLMKFVGHEDVLNLLRRSPDRYQVQFSSWLNDIILPAFKEGEVHVEIEVPREENPHAQELSDAEILVRAIDIIKRLNQQKPADSADACKKDRCPLSSLLEAIKSSEGISREHGHKAGFSSDGRHLTDLFHRFF